MSTQERGIENLPSRDEAIALLKSVGASSQVIAHCVAVSSLAVHIAKKCKKPVNIQLVEIAGLLHDIGRSKTHAITHAVEGAKIASEKGLPVAVINIIERHIGAGVPKDEAIQLGLPAKDYLPITLEEKIIAHADNLLSGEKRISVKETVGKLVRKNQSEAAKRMVALHKELSDLCGADLDTI